MDPFDPASAESPFKGSPRFELKRRIGAGGMGVVYEAFDRKCQTTVALKTLRNLDAESIYRLKREFRALQHIEHPNLVRLGELIFHLGHWFFTMELVDGTDIVDYICEERPDIDRSSTPPSQDTVRLEQPPIAFMEDCEQACEEPLAIRRSNIPSSQDTRRIDRPPIVFTRDREHSFDEARLRHSMRQLAEGLNVLHNAGKVHRDVKPSNVLVTEEGRVVLLDFGLIAHRDPGLSSEARIVGTPIYMAPEQATSARVGAAADWYSFGVVLYEALTGAAPYQGTDIQILMEKQQHRPARPSALLADVPPDLDELCVSLLNRLPEERPSAERILTLLGGARESKNAAAAQTSPPSASTMPFVGRDDELDAIRTAYEAGAENRSVIVFVHGESGIGKTELVHRFLEELQLLSRDLVILAGRCHQRETVPYNVFDEVADSIARYMRTLPESTAAGLLPRRASLLCGLFPVLGRIDALAKAPLARSEERDTEQRRAKMFQAFRELLDKVAETARLVIWVDNYQWADAESLDLMSAIFRGPEALPVLFIGLVRTSAGSGTCPALEAARNRLEDICTVEVGPLPFDESRKLIELAAPDLAAANPACCVQIAREARGHPLHVQELLHYVRTNPEQELSEVSLERALRSRVAGLDVEARALLEIIVTAQAPVRPAIASSACHKEPAECDASISRLRDASLVRASGTQGNEHIEAAHERVRDAVFSDLSNERLRELHHALSVALEQAGYAESHPQALIRHLEGAGETARAAVLAERAAQRAAAASAFDRAAELYRDCLRLCASGNTGPSDLHLRLGAALSKAGRLAEAAEALLTAAEHADARTRLECLGQAAEQLMVSGNLERGAQVVSTLLAEIENVLPGTPTRPGMRLSWSRFRLWVRCANWEERRRRDVDEAKLAVLNVCESLDTALDIADTSRSAALHARYCLLALGIGEPLRVGRAIAREARYLSSGGRRSQARARLLIAKSKEILSSHPDRYLEARILTAEATLQHMTGNFRVTDSSCERAEDIYRQHVSARIWELNSTRMLRLVALRHLGDISRVVSLSNEWVRDVRRRGDLLTETSIRCVRSFAWLASGKPSHALYDLERVADASRRGSIRPQHWHELEAATELALYENRASQALEERARDFEHLLASPLGRVPIVRATARWLLGRLALATAEEGHDRPTNLNLATRCAKQVARQRTAYGEPWSLLLASGIAAQKGNWDRASALLARAEELATRAGMAGYLAAAQVRRAQIIGGGVGRGMVAEAEDTLRRNGISASDHYVQIIVPGFAGG